MNSTTLAVICSVINKQHWSHKCGCQYIHYNSAPDTHHKLRRWSAIGNTTHTLPPHPLPHLAWRPSCFGQHAFQELRNETQRNATQRNATQSKSVTNIVPEGGNATSPLHGGPQQRGQNQKSKPTPGVTMMHHATKRGFKDCPGFLNSTGRLGPKRGRKCYVTPAFSGVPNKGDKIRSQNLHRGSP